MASKISSRMVAIVVLAFSLLVQVTLGGIICEDLGHDTCAFAVSSAGKRCVLEKHVKRTGEEAYTCKTSEIEADKLNDHVETDQCIQACGLERKCLGISSDSLLESNFRQKLCSTQCYKSCPNVIDLFFNLAAGEGVFLPKLCEAQGANERRGMAEIRSSGIVAPGPVKSESLTALPAAGLVAPASAPH
ncbi:PAR1 protein [Quillaja saponaria]|uniref:PAR1 protein n=1 Tax=Quillaja saponaria TaxID=32244 RepID=A0AAD7VFY6_QUISA|nr:PAR1 protein [Quillaja saponaria]